jgi:hypothetical protein
VLTGPASFALNLKGFAAQFAGTSHTVSLTLSVGPMVSFKLSVWDRLVRMSDTQVSGAARQMAAQRWGASRPVRLARELALRAAELPDPERVRLLNALERAASKGGAA